MYLPKLPKDIRCPLEYALELFAGRWKSRILCMLYTNRTMRYGEIKKKLEGMTDTVLAATLKELLSDELVVRNQYPEIPPRVEYSLTKKAQSLVPMLRHICQWASDYHLPDEMQNSLMAHCRQCPVLCKKAAEKGISGLCTESQQ